MTVSHGTTTYGAAAPTSNMLINLAHFTAFIFTFFVLSSLSCSAPPSHHFFHTKLFFYKLHERTAKIGKVPVELRDVIGQSSVSNESK